LRILILEDETLIALNLAEELRMEGYEVSGPAGTIKEAAELLDRDPIDFAVLDANINGIAPVSLAEKLGRRGPCWALQSMSWPVPRNPARRAAPAETAANGGASRHH